jgi:acyl dehydratase
MKLTIGDNYKEALRFSQQNVIDFANVSGDNNPIHLDADYAATTQFGKPIMHGMISGCVFTRIMGTQFPGFGSIYLSQTIEFKRPMFVETDYEAIFIVKTIDLEKHRAEIFCEIIDKITGKTTTTGTATMINKERF